MDRLVKRCGNNPAVPTGFDLDFILDLRHKEDEGLQAIFDRLCGLEEKIEKDELTGVVRCKDCKFYELKGFPDGKMKMNCENSKGIWTNTKPDDFCSYGERRDGE